MKLAIDTNAYVAFCRNEAWAVEPVRRANQVSIPLMVLAELRAGFACGTRSADNERTLSKFLDVERVRILEPNVDTAFHYAHIFLQLRRQGTPIPTNDIWIASLAVQHGLTLLTGDSHFDRVAQIPRA